MKKKLVCLVMAGVLSAMCLGCASQDANTGQDTQNDTQVNNEENSQKEESPVDGIVYEELSRESLLDESAAIEQITNLIVDETSFIASLNTDLPETEEHEINGSMYLLVDTATSWLEYENLAGTYYADSYITEKFTPEYTVNTKTFVEQDGKLYRAISDGEGITLEKDSVEVWQNEDGTYYVTVLVHSDVENDYRGYLVKVAENVYGYEIIDKVNVY